MSRITLPPPSRIAFASVQGPNGPIAMFVSPEWARYFESLNTLSNDTAIGPGGVADLNADDTWHDDLSAREAMQGVDEMRNEISSLRSENNALRQSIEAIEALIADHRTGDQLRARIEQIEERLP